jgi:hypothetical protein
VGALQAVVSGVVTIVVYTLILFGIFKVFQIAGQVSEIKDLLQDIKRNTQDIAPSALVHSQSPESLMRAVSAAEYPSSDPVETSVEP